jgi:repressor LexA
MLPLTDRQAAILDFIRRKLAVGDAPPTREEIALAFGFNRAAADQHLRAIAQKGHISLLPGSSRGIRLAEEARRAMDETLLPLVGRVAAGPPVLATGEVDDHYQVDPRLFRPQAHYLRRVKGDSMIEMGIQDGDLVGVHQTPTAENGQVVVAKLFRKAGPEITVKVFRRRGDVVRLLPRNAALEPIVVDLREEEFEIEGLYCGHIHPGR